MSLQELNHLRTSSASTRAETLQFIKLVLHKGDEAVRIFLMALKISFGDTILKQLLTTANLGDSLKGKKEFNA